MKLVVIDLVPALLSWEGRDRHEEASVASGAGDAIHDMSHRYLVVGTADAEESTTALRHILDLHGIADMFTSVATSATFGPKVSPRVVRRLAATHRTPPEQVAVVTAREHLARPMHRSRMSVVVTTHDEFDLVPDALASLEAGRIIP